MLYINMLLIYLPYIIYLFICCINPHHKQIIALSLPPLYTAQNTLVSLTLVHQMCGGIRWKGGLRPINTAAWVSGEPVLKPCCTTWGSQPEPLWIHSCERCFIIAVRCFFYGKKRPQRNILSSSLQVRINRVHALLTCVSLCVKCRAQCVLARTIAWKMCGVCRVSITPRCCGSVLSRSGISATKSGWKSVL